MEVRDGKIYINGEDNPYYTFKYDYYWMEGDNRDRSLDSRYWVFGLLTVDEERGVFESGKIRWNRILTNPNPDKSKAGEKGWSGE